MELHINHIVFQIVWQEHMRCILDFFILENVIVVYEGVKWNYFPSLDVVLIKIDFKKSSNKVEW